jgi:hypothetical protein
MANGLDTATEECPRRSSSTAATNYLVCKTGHRTRCLISPDHSSWLFPPDPTARAGVAWKAAGAFNSTMWYFMV